MKHTPASWILSENINTCGDKPFKEYCIEDSEGNIIGFFTNKSNANLIATSPDMYEVLKAAIEHMQDPYPAGDDLSHILARAGKALAKAEGKA